MKEDTITLKLNKEEARHLLQCLIRTGAKGKDLKIGLKIEGYLHEFILNAND